VIGAMLHMAVRAPFRVTQGVCSRRPCGQLQPFRADWKSTRTRRNCQLSRPNRAAAPPEGDGVAVNVTYNTLWEQILTFPKRRPFATNIIIATVKTSIADLLVQKGEGKEKIDWKRNGVFTAFGFAYLGIAQWFIYVTVFTRVCPNAIRFSNLSFAEKLKDRAGQIDLLKQTFYDNFVHYTFIYFPVFYIFKESIQGDGGVTPDLAQRALNKYWNNCVKDNLAMWSLWVPFDLFIYAAPVWMRLPLNHGVSAAWTMILSWMRGGE